MNALLASVSSYALLISAPTSVSTLTVAAGKVTSDLTRFPMRINLADMPTSFWNAVSAEGGNVRVTNAADVALPLDIVSINKTAKTGEAFVLVSLSAASTNVFRVKTYATLTAPPKSDPVGQHAVWSDYKTMYSMTSFEDRSGKTPGLMIEGDTNNFRYTSSAVSPFDLWAHQGVAADATSYYIIDTTQIRRYTNEWTLRATINLSSVGLPANVNHFGDGCLWNGYLVVTAEQYPNAIYNAQYLVFINVATMTVSYILNISAGGHEVSSIVYHPTRDRFYVSEYTPTGNSRLHVYKTDGTYEGPWAHQGSLPQKQGVSYYNGRFYVSGGIEGYYQVNSIDDTTGAVRLEWQGTKPGYIEGIHCLANGNFLLLYDGGGQSRVHTFIPTSGSVVSGWLNLDGRGNAKIQGVAPSTAWTMGASYITNYVGGANRAVLSWSEEVPENLSRATLSQRFGGTYGVWNSDNGWVDASAPTPAVGARVRLHHTQDGTSNRKIYANGVQRGAQNAVSQRPSANAQTLYLGAEDTSYAERMAGAINYVYLREGEMPAAFLKAEYDSWETATFYTLGA